MSSAPHKYRDRVHHEVIDGVRKELPPVGAREAHLASMLMLYLAPFAMDQKLGRCFIQMLFRLDPNGEWELRPDVSFVSVRKWPLRQLAPATEAWDVIPDLAVEVINPSDTANDVNRKVRDYFRTGVQRVWVIWPETQQVHVYESLTRVQIFLRDDTLTGEPLVPGFRLPLVDLFVYPPPP